MTRLLRKLLRASFRLPVARVVGPPPVNARGVALDREVHVMTWLEAHVYGAAMKGSPAAARRSLARAIGIVAKRPTATLRVEEGRLAGVRVRTYRPPSDAGVVFVYLHGGGWAAGDLDTHDGICRRIASEAGRVVISVDYRLAPEHPFPAGLDDVVAVVREVRAAHPRVELGGDSAGGNLTAAACIVLRDAGERLPDLQVLIYPGLDQRRLTASHREFAHGFLLTTDDLDWYQGHYRYGDPLDPRASPGLVPDARGLPPAIVASAGFDPLRDEAEDYVAKLRAAGVPVVHLDEATLVHGYAQMDGAVREADRAVGRLVAAIRAAG